VYTGGRSVNTISGVRDFAGGSCWRCAEPSTLRRYVGGGVNVMMRGMSPGFEDGRRGEENHADGQSFV